MLQKWLKFNLGFAEPVEFYQPSTVEELDNLLVHFKKHSSSNVDSNSTLEEGKMFEKKEKSDEPIAMGNVFRRLNFFLTVSWESKYGCLYIFCVIHPEKATWKLISL